MSDTLERLRQKVENGERLTLQEKRALLDIAEAAQALKAAATPGALPSDKLGDLWRALATLDSTGGAER